MAPRAAGASSDPAGAASVLGPLKCGRGGCESMNKKNPPSELGGLIQKQLLSFT
jgi:hypothetical protein